MQVAPPTGASHVHAPLPQVSSSATPAHLHCASVSISTASAHHHDRMPAAHAPTAAALATMRASARSTVPETTATLLVLNAARALRSSEVAGAHAACLSPPRPLLPHAATPGQPPQRQLDAGVRPDVFVPPAHRVGYGGFFATFNFIRLQDIRETLRAELAEESDGLERLGDLDAMLSLDDEHNQQRVRSFEDGILEAARSTMMVAGAAEAAVLMRRRERGEPLESAPGRRHRGYSRGQPRHPLT